MRYTRSTLGMTVVYSGLYGSAGAAPSGQEDTAFSSVIDYYQSQNDVNKAAAAERLYKSQHWHYGISRHLNRPLSDSLFCEFTKRPETRKNSLFQTYLDSMGYCIEAGERVYDADTITADYLRENIDLAFDSWNKPWARNVSFQDFCKYILPYRGGEAGTTSVSHPMK